MLMRFDPFRDLDHLFRGQGRTPVVALDAYREGDRFVVQADVPGVDPSSMDLTVEKNILTVRAERQAAHADGQEWLVNERAGGSYERQLFLGEGLDTDHIEAHYDQGVLTVTIPVAEAAKPGKIEIAAGAQKAIEATAEAA